MIAANMQREIEAIRRDKRGKPLKTEYSRAIHDRVDKLLNRDPKDIVRDPQETDMEAFNKNTREFLNCQGRC
jgi:hypothetical protein